jgi:hypothetical protein
VRQRRAEKPQPRYTDIPSKAPARIERSSTSSIVKASGSWTEFGTANEREFTLRDIPDCVTRKKVADLMAVSPAISVKDLHGLLLDLDGDLDAARKQTIRASRAPSARPLVMRELLSTELPQYAGNPDHFLYDDEVMVKIDPTGPSLKWVSNNF